MYSSVLFIGVNNCSTVQPVVATERSVFYRERAAGMYSSFPYALAQVCGWLPIHNLKFTFLEQIKWWLQNSQCFFNAGDNWNTICVLPDGLLYSYCICNGWLSVDSWKILLVLLCQFLYFPLLYLLRFDDSVYHTKPPSSLHFRWSFLYTLLSLLWLLHPKTSEYIFIL